MSLIVLFITSILAGNAVLTEYLGVTSILGINKERSALRIGFLIASMTFLTSSIFYSVYHNILEPFHITYLSTISIVIVMMFFLPIMEYIAKKYYPSLDESFGTYISTLIVNCTVMGITLLAVQKNYSFTETILYSLGSSIGFVLILYVFSTLSERMNISPIIRSLKKFPITLITIGIIAIIFSRYIGN